MIDDRLPLMVNHETQTRAHIILVNVQLLTYFCRRGAQRDAKPPQASRPQASSLT